MNANSKCGGCLWYGAPHDGNKLGECQNAESAFYWNQGDDRSPVQIAPNRGACACYKSARAFLGEDNRSGMRPVTFVSFVVTGLFQLTYPLVLTALFFYYVFRSAPERYDEAFTGTESEKTFLQ